MTDNERYARNKQTMTGENIAQFSRQCVNGYSQNYTALITGSLSDLPLQYYIENPSDVDLLSWHNDIHIFPENYPIPRQIRGQFYKLETYYSPPGFARIIAYDNSGNWNYCGRKSRLADPNNGPAFTQVRLEDHYKLASDLVIGLRYSVWPSSAYEWNERIRHNGWPSSEIIERIVNSGCHLVLKAHPSHPDDENEWRFSFSLAESTLAQTWNDVQQYIYRTLRLIKTKIVEKAGGNEMTILRTYHFKTLMFWACEEEGSSFWEETRIEASLKELLGRMISSLIEMRCSNYFIPSCNLFDCQSIGPQPEIELLLSYVQAHNLDLPQKLMTKSCIHFSLPRKSILMFQMGLNCLNLANPRNPAKVLSSLNRLAKSSLLTEEIRWIYKAISTHRDICSDRRSGEDKLSEVQEALRCFSLSKRNDMESDSFPITIRPYDSLYAIINEFGFLKGKSESGNISQYLKSETVTDLMDKPDFLRDIFTIMDIMNHQFIRPSYFIRAAYEANFYYTVLHDHDKAIQICDDAFKVLDTQKRIKIFNLGAEWVDFASGCLSIPVMGAWTRLFDEAIVVTMGFLALFNAVTAASRKLKATSKTVIYLRKISCLIGPRERLAFRINPIDFLRYIHLQCSRLIDGPQSKFSNNSSDFLTVCLMVSYRMEATITEN